MSDSGAPVAPMATWSAHELLAPRYSSQFLAQSSSEELILDCAAAGLEGPQSTWNVHTRLALSWPAAQRLQALLERALAGHTGRAGDPHTARLPGLGNRHG